MTDLIKGYDISVLQGNVNFDNIAKSGAKFIISRAGIGNNGIDANLNQNLQGTQSAGLLPAVYHFVFPLPATPAQPLRDPVKQAQYHFNSAPGQLTFCDLEWPVQANWQKWGCTQSQIIGWTLSYLEEYKKLNSKDCIIYTYPNFMQTLGNPASFASYQLWIASYEATSTVPKPWNDWVMWQSSGGTECLPGTSVKVDVDYVKDLSLWIPAPISSGSVITIPNLSLPVAPPSIAKSPPTVVPEPPKPSLLSLLGQLISGLFKSFNKKSIPTA
jgi:lysozyme